MGKKILIGNILFVLLGFHCLAQTNSGSENVTLNMLSCELSLDIPMPYRLQKDNITNEGVSYMIFFNETLCRNDSSFIMITEAPMCRFDMDFYKADSISCSGQRVDEYGMMNGKLFRRSSLGRIRLYYVGVGKNDKTLYDNIIESVKIRKETYPSCKSPKQFQSVDRLSNSSTKIHQGTKTNKE